MKKQSKKKIKELLKINQNNVRGSVGIPGEEFIPPLPEQEIKPAGNYVECMIS